MLERMQLDAVLANLQSLGGRRLGALAIIGVAVFAAVAFGSYYLSRPDFEPLYAGLTPQDVSRIGAVLQDEGIDFDVNPEGTKVSVPVGQTARARRVLAEKGLPGSPSAGYELYEKVGPIGLTSFMQEVTRTRVLEGEIARTIQGMKGVKAARVHIVLPDQGSFRRARQPASASVVIRTEVPGDGSASQAIRHLVAAAVPGMAADQVRVLSTDGTVLAGTDETGTTASSSKMVELEKTISKEMQENVRRTLAPYLGIDNFEISVATRLNLDKRQTNETNFDPESKVERSVKSVKETGKSQNDSGKAAVSVEQNVPGSEASTAAGGGNSKSNERREELTNFELNSKSVATVSEGYRIEALTVAVMINRRQLAASLGASPSQEVMESRIKEIETLVGSAAGVDLKRGDRVSVVAVDFIETGALEPIAGPGVGEIIAAQFGSILRAVTIIGVAALLVFFGLKPATRMLLENKTAAAIADASSGLAALPQPQLVVDQPVVIEQAAPEPEANFLADLTRRAGNVPAQRLEKIIDLDEAQAAAILKQWMKSA